MSYQFGNYIRQFSKISIRILFASEDFFVNKISKAVSLRNSKIIPASMKRREPY